MHPDGGRGCGKVPLLLLWLGEGATEGMGVICIYGSGVTSSPRNSTRGRGMTIWRDRKLAFMVCLLE